MSPCLARDLLVFVPSGVTVVTARDPAHADHGMTVSAFVPVSVEPPLLLVCIARRAGMHRVLRGATHFGVNVLRADAAEVARRFSSPGERFNGVDVERGASGVPLLRDAVARLECRVERRHRGGDHTLFLGRIVDGRIDGGEPLLYASHAFGRLEVREPSRARLSVDGRVMAPASMERGS